MQEHNHDGFPHAPTWSLIVGHLGFWSIVATIIFSVLGIVLAFGQPGSKAFQLRRWAFVAACLGVFLSFGSLVTLLLSDQFHFEYVFGHSEKKNPIFYKLSATWTAQEGSFLLWAATTAFWGIVTFRKSEHYERIYTSTFSFVLAALAACITFESPFGYLEGVVQGGHIVAPPDGMGMIPTLQNYWLVIHPPTMFLGFGALTISFAYAISALITGDHQRWIHLTRAVSLVGLTVLGVGIVMGGLWAYETQGWGGFWAWDPVENVSLVPWLFAAVFSHGIIIQSARKQWMWGNLFLGTLPLLSFIYGTFLTRSGKLTEVSVHSFASMDGNALKILLGFLGISFLGTLSILGWKFAKRDRTMDAAPSDLQEKPKSIDRQAVYQVGLMSLSLLAVVVALGMSWPILSVWFTKENKVQSIGQTVYHRAVVWFFIGIMVPMAVAPFVSWKKESFGSVGKRLWVLINLAVGFTGLMIILFKNPNFGVSIDPNGTVDGLLKNSTYPLVPVMALLILFCVFTAFSNFWRAVELWKRSRSGIGAFIAHLGLAVLLGGLIISKGFERTGQMIVRDGEPGSILDYTISFRDYDVNRSTDRDNVVRFDVQQANGNQFEITPTLYYYMRNNEENAQTWPFIRRKFSHDTYFFMQPPQINYFPQPISLKPGQTVTQNDVTITYLEPTKKGTPGMSGAEFGAKLKVSYENQSYEVNPTLKMEDGQLIPSLPKVSNIFRAAIMGMNAADRSVQAQLLLDPPNFPIVVFYKPLTCLVWIGTGLFTLGGLMAAFYRRGRKSNPEGDFMAKTATIGS